MRSCLLLVASFFVLAGAAENARGAATSWRWPLRGEVQERFALGANPYARGWHRGVDLAAPHGATVRAACAGRVRFTGRAGSFGRAVTVRCGPFVVSYGHLSAIDAGRGERIRAGQRIGRVGTTGRPSSPRPHLHLGVRRAGRPHGYVDPLRLLPRRPPAAGPPPVPGRVRREPPAPAPAREPAPARLPLAAQAGFVLLVATVPGLTVVTAARRRRGRRNAQPARVREARG